MRVTDATPKARALPLACALLLMLTAACAQKPEVQRLSDIQLDPSRQDLALREVADLQSKGQRVWCVPYARNLSGINIRGNAETWWGQAKDLYNRGKQPAVGAVMAFSSSRKIPMGHVAVVSDVVSPREVLVDHANWHRNEVSLKMAVQDVSPNNDWSQVRLESNPGTFGSPYAVSGFIYPQRVN
ncbi:CHAP domain-containing protein [Salipiger sp. CCB-MM3]|uniref:CHAP domain-containing protein n=1 Tax=Roseobacteraceae TaxID=2854170 RepID=UPI00080AC158|nr:CHAP domain-containing protein [Salipiger sp. CCB-MM3]